MKGTVLYNRLAGYYDKIFIFKNYKMEVDFILQIFKKYKIKVRNILDVGCGTGSHDKLLSLKGFNVTGVDVSEDMLDIAKKKVRKGVFLKGDMKNLNTVVSKEYDAVLLMYNSIGYNTNKRDFRKTLKGVYNHLRKGGVLIFDLSTKERNGSYTRNYFFSDKNLFGFKHLDSRIGKGVIVNSSDYLIKDGFNFIVVRNDIQRFGLYTDKEVKFMMKREGFKTVVFHGWSFKKRKSRASIFVGFKS